jgi:hypothetical protein
MITAQAAIYRYRRDVAVGRVLRSLLFAAGIAAGVVLPLLVDGFDAYIGLALVLGVWLMLGVTSAKNSRILVPSTALIATGQFEEAERRIDQAMHAFTMSRTSKLLGLHHLTVLRHKQRRWQDAVTLGRAVLKQHLTAFPSLERATRLILADSLLETGDVRGAGESLAPLRFHSLDLQETLAMLQVELDVMSRQGAWDAMLAGLPGKVQLAELLPPGASAKVQAMLALAAQKRGVTQWSDWLRRRVELLTDVGKLCEDRPVLWELWQKSEPAAS